MSTASNIRPLENLNYSGTIFQSEIGTRFRENDTNFSYSVTKAKNNQHSKIVKTCVFSSL